jgi:hypothetical protein
VKCTDLNATITSLLNQLMSNYSQLYILTLDNSMKPASRHMAGASISQVTDAVATVVSESSMVRVFDDIAPVTMVKNAIAHYSYEEAHALSK